ncbi:MAG: hypothetical protein V1924_07790 [Candidatus Bathyarchaeota archaeon]|jgi:hypothetical protein
MGLNVATLQTLLKDENCLKVLTHCKEPKTFNEIKKTKIGEGKIFSVLKDLKTSEALLFADGKYYTSPDAMKFLE